MDSVSPILEVNNIEVVYNKAIQVLRGLSLSVPKGQIVALLGSNGAGKSTTLKAISNLLELQDGALTRGDIRFDGRDTRGQPPHALVRSGVFHVMEGRHVFEDLTIEENLVAATYALTGRRASQADFDLVYEYFPRLHERRRGLAGYLSGGEQQMLAMARALMGRPKLLLLDEPSMGLAPMMVAQIFDVIREIAQQGVTILLVEQNVRQALAVADRGYVMESGRIVLQDTADHLLRDERVRAAYLGV